VRSLWVKLLTGFALVTLVAVGMVAFAANVVTTRQFDRYLRWGGQIRAQRIAPLVAEYYTRGQSWQGVERLLEGLSESGMRRRGSQQAPSLMRERVVLANAEGVVIFDSQGQDEGRQLGNPVLRFGEPVMVDGQRVGTVLVAPWERVPAGSLERRFLTAVNLWLLFAGLLAGGLALILGLYLAWQITAPLRQLRSAAQAIAGGDLSRRVKVTSGDEIGDLGRAFNHMAQALERNEQLRRRVMADIAHELRTPLSVIRANLEGLQDGVFALDRESLAPIHEQTLLLTRLVEDLRQLALAEAGRLALERQMVNLADLMQQVVESHRAQAAEKGIELGVDIPQPLPALPLDPQRIGQVLHNLLANALRYTPSEGNVTVACWPLEVRQGQLLSSHSLPEALLPLTENHWVALSVADTGPGIDLEDLPHVFERFYRGDRSRSRSSGGTGLGLAIARQLVEAHGGRIAVANEPQGGARFTFVLPVSESH
jgi:signal transduction histidine kinase